MAKKKLVYVCSECGKEYPKWQGKCDACGEWNTLTEFRTGGKSKTSRKARGVEPVKLSEAGTESAERSSTGYGEFDRVLGGGVVEGSVVLISGEPGIGKSTLLLQVALDMASRGSEILYVCGEESAAQVRMRADRVGDSGFDRVTLLPDNSLEPALSRMPSFDALVVDSIQAISSEEISSAPGNISQVRHCTARLVDAAKAHGVPVFIVGHVTKSGSIAGPKVLEHAVDVVLELEGEVRGEYRLLRCQKNRFGTTGEMGVFSMGERGFIEVTNPSAAFLSHHESPVPGSVIFAGIEGRRPLFVEIQALVAPSVYGTPQRVCQGLDPKRLVLLSAVLERRGGIPLSKYDIFVNVVGGVNLSERASDLPLVLAVVSSFRDTPVDSKVAVFGEVGITGELRKAPRSSLRLREAERLGFSEALTPAPPASEIPDGLNCRAATDLFSAFKVVFKKPQ